MLVTPGKTGGNRNAAGNNPVQVELLLTPNIFHQRQHHYLISLVQNYYLILLFSYP